MKITFSEFERCMENVQFPLAVATSGGADSLALLLLAHALGQKNEDHVVALTVDHGLRTASKKEALQVQKWAHDRGIEHHILEWKGEKPSFGLQKKAREKRYSLLIDWCKNNNIPTLLLGHHQQDQEETFWLRLSSGSGLEGLTAMKRQVVRDGIICLRPLLGFSKERLRATLIAENQPWIEDPSNQSPQFFRGRWRTFLEEEGLSSFRLLKVIEKLQGDADFIQHSLYKALKTLVQVYDEGYVTVQKKAFEDLHPALAKRLVSFLMQWFSDANYPPRSQQVLAIMEKIKMASAFTAGGIYWRMHRQEIHLFREILAIQGQVSFKDLQTKSLWDHRFWIDTEIKKYIPQETFLAPLGHMSSLKKEIAPSLPGRVWPTLPALWVKGEVVAIPALCYNLLKGDQDLRKFIYIKPLFHDSLRFTI